MPPSSITMVVQDSKLQKTASRVDSLSFFGLQSHAADVKPLVQHLRRCNVESV